MATKSEVNIFIDTQNRKATTEIDKKYSKMVSDRQFELLEERGFAQKAMALQVKINELHTLASALENDMCHDEILSLNTYYMVASELSDFIGESQYIEKMRQRGRFDRTNVPLIKDEWSNTINETNKQYSNLRNAVKQMKADKALAHLESMGFDITPLKNNTTETALLALVDKTKLFYPRKTEETNQEEESGE